MKIKKGDFVEIEYVAREKETGKIFDLTNEETAKENNLYNEKATYGPITICVGYHDILPGLDDEIINKEPGNYKIELKAEKAFGKKNPNLMKLFPTSTFTKQNINPMPGLQLNLGGLLATVRTVTGGRTLLDFNHPLAGRDIIYEIKINKIITDTKEKVKVFLKLHFNQEKFTLQNSILELEFELPEEAKKKLEEEIKKRIPEIKSVKFKNISTPQ